MRESIDIDARHVFGVDAAGYDAGRLVYPDRIYEILSQRCGLERASRVFEIGAGSGIATRRRKSSPAAYSLMSAEASVTSKP